MRGDQAACPDTQGNPPLPGVWPAMVVVLSGQVFDVQRTPADADIAPDQTPCAIQSVTVSPGRQYVFQYLKDAVQRGVTLVLRVDSPGNFQDAVEPGKPHRLLLGSE